MGTLKDGECCTEQEKCSLGGGDCDKDSECVPGTVCGKDNCQDFHPTAAKLSDCCIEKSKTYPLFNFFYPKNNQNLQQSQGRCSLL